MSNINSSKYRKPDYVGPAAANGLYALAGVTLVAFNETSGSAQVIFPEVPVGAIQSRYIYNPNASGTITIRIRDNIAAPSVAANGDDTIAIPAGQGWSDSCTNQIDVLMPNTTSKISYGER